MKTGLASLAKDVFTLGRIAAGTYTRSSAFCGPFFVQMDVTHGCNLRCVFCNTQHPKDWHAALDPRLAMDFNMFKAVVADLEELGTRQITFSGAGEPSLHKDIVEMVCLAADLGIKTSMNTNGVLQEEKATALLDARIDRISVSLNAATSETHRNLAGIDSGKPFDTVMKFLSLVCDRRKKDRKSVSLRLSFVLSSLNFHEIVKMTEVARKYGADGIRYIIGIDLDRSEETRKLMVTGKESLDQMKCLLIEAQEIAGRSGIDSNAEEIAHQVGEMDLYRCGKSDAYARLPCLAGWYFANITATGQVLPCCGCSESLGDLNRDSFKDIWFSRRYKEFRFSYKNDPLRPLAGMFRCSGCTDCPFVYYNRMLYSATRPWSRLTRRKR